MCQQCNSHDHATEDCGKSAVDLLVKPVHSARDRVWDFLNSFFRDYDLLKAAFEDNAAETIQLRERLTAEWQRAERMKMSGAKLANCAFNLAQRAGDTLSADDTTILDQLRKEWDAVASV